MHVHTRSHCASVIKEWASPFKIFMYRYMSARARAHASASLVTNRSSIALPLFSAERRGADLSTCHGRARARAEEIASTIHTRLPARSAIARCSSKSNNDCRVVLSRPALAHSRRARASLHVISSAIAARLVALSQARRAISTPRFNEVHQSFDPPLRRRSLNISHGGLAGGQSDLASILKRTVPSSSAVLRIRAT